MADRIEEAARGIAHQAVSSAIVKVTEHGTTIDTELAVPVITALVRREVEREREECAKVCDPSYTCGCSAMIRARKDVPGE